MSRNDPLSNVGQLFRPGAIFGRPVIYAPPPVVRPTAAPPGKTPGPVSDPLGLATPKTPGAETPGQSGVGFPNIIVKKITVPASGCIPVQVPFVARSVRMIALSGLANAFTSDTAIPDLDPFGFPIDPSWIGGTAALGSDVTLAVPTGVQTRAIAIGGIPGPANAGLVKAQQQDGADHIWLLDDGTNAVALDLIGGVDGSYAPFGVIAPDPTLILGGPPCVKFDGNGGYVAIPLRNPGNGTGSFTIEFMTNFYAHTTDPFTSQNLFSCDGTRTGLKLLQQSNHLKLVVSTDVGDVAFTTTQSFDQELPQGTTHLVDVTYDQSLKLFTLYIDGNVIGTISGHLFVGSNGTTIAFGADFSAFPTITGHAYEHLQAISFYSRALTQNQIQTHFAAAQGSPSGVAPAEILLLVSDLLTLGGGGGTPQTSGASKLSQLGDVKIGSLLDGEVLTYVSAAGKWENVALPSDVASLQGLTGALAIQSADGSVTIVTFGGNAIDLHAVSLPLANGDLPGPSLMADPSGACIGVNV